MNPTQMLFILSTFGPRMKVVYRLVYVCLCGGVYIREIK